MAGSFGRNLPHLFESYKAMPRTLHEIRVTKFPDSRKDRLHESTYASLHSWFWIPVRDAIEAHS